MHHAEPPMQQNKNPIAVESKCRDTDEAGNTKLNLWLSSKVWI
jgi:hypothetical protein